MSKQTRLEAIPNDVLKLLVSIKSNWSIWRKGDTTIEFRRKVNDIERNKLLVLQSEANQLFTELIIEAENTLQPMEQTKVVDVLQAQRIWTRFERVYNTLNGDDLVRAVVASINNYGKKKDSDALTVLFQELPSYLVSRGRTPEIADMLDQYYEVFMKPNYLVQRNHLAELEMNKITYTYMFREAVRLSQSDAFNLQFITVIGYNGTLLRP